MNVFVVDEDPCLAARALGDRHVVKMVLESAQIMCTVASRLGHVVPYRPTHVNHPCVVWARESAGNWRWLVAHARALAVEYEFRYGRRHKSLDVIDEVAKLGPRAPGFGPWARAMPVAYHLASVVDSYRLYYHMDKGHLHDYEHGRRRPEWLPPRRGRLFEDARSWTRDVEGLRRHKIKEFEDNLRRAERIFGAVGRWDYGRSRRI